MCILSLLSLIILIPLCIADRDYTCFDNIYRGFNSIKCKVLIFSLMDINNGIYIQVEIKFEKKSCTAA